MGQTWGGMSSTINVNELTEMVRHQAQEKLGFAQLCNAPDGGNLGRKKGDTVQYEYFTNISIEGGLLDENEDVPEGSVTAISGSYTFAEYGNSLRYTKKLVDLSRIDVEDPFMKALTDDMKKLENRYAYAQFDATHWKASFAATNEFVTNNTLTVACTADLSLANLRFVRKKAELKLIPTYDGEDYVYVTGVESADALQYDSTITTALSNSGSARAALNGEIGRVSQCRIIKDLHKIVKVGGSASGAGANLDEGFLVGADAVQHDVAVPWEISVEDRDHGRKIKVAYLGIMAWKKILSQSLHSKEHVIKVDSQ